MFYCAISWSFTSFILQYDFSLEEKVLEFSEKQREIEEEKEKREKERKEAKELEEKRLEELKNQEQAQAEKELSTEVPPVQKNDVVPSSSASLSTAQVLPVTSVSSVGPSGILLPVPIAKREAAPVPDASEMKRSTSFNVADFEKVKVYFHIHIYLFPSDKHRQI